MVSYLLLRKEAGKPEACRWFWMNFSSQSVMIKRVTPAKHEVGSNQKKPCCTVSISVCFRSSKFGCG